MKFFKQLFSWPLRYIPFPSLTTTQSTAITMEKKDKVDSSSTKYDDALKLLPEYMFKRVSSHLSVDEREILAYLINRSIKSGDVSWFLPPDHNKKSCNQSNNKKNSIPSKNNNKKSADEEKNKLPFEKKKACVGPARFNCHCFHCFTSYWTRWGCAPHRELISNAIRAFEYHFMKNGEQQSKNETTSAAGGKGKKGKRSMPVRRRNVSPEKKENHDETVEEATGSWIGNLIKVIWTFIRYRFFRARRN